MATRHALRLVQRRFSSSGKALSQEEKASENIFVKGSHLKPPTMATKHALRLVQHRFSSSGKVLSEEEKATENAFSKKKEQEMLEKFARKKAEYNKLAQQIEALKKEIASLKEEVNRIRSKYEELHAEAEHALTNDPYNNLVFMGTAMFIFFCLVG